MCGDVNKCNSRYVVFFRKRSDGPGFDSPLVNGRQKWTQARIYRIYDNQWFELKALD